jgi:two-component system, chemotaxis family, chemotaxis protein CheY
MADTAKELIVVAEDSAPNRTILVHLLKKLGYEVIEAANGKLAWDALESLPPETHVSAILSDIMMPEKDGIELLRSVRATERYSRIPFVLITAVSDKDYIMQAKSLNVSGYILKPVTFQRVLSKLQELFPAKQFPKLAV